MYITSPDTGGTPLAPMWVSVVQIHEGQTFKGTPHPSKIRAEMSAAQRAYDYIIKLPTSIPESLTLDKKFNHFIAVLVDVENCPNIIPELLRSKTEKLVIIGFVGKYHPQAESGWDQDPRVRKILVPSTRRDGTDTCMIMYTSVFLFDKTYDEYIVVTSDHFGPALVDMITASDLLWESRPARCFNKTEQIIKYLIDIKTDEIPDKVFPKPPSRVVLPRRRPTAIPRR